MKRFAGYTFVGVVLVIFGLAGTGPAGEESASAAACMTQRKVVIAFDGKSSGAGKAACELSCSRKCVQNPARFSDCSCDESLNCLADIESCSGSG